MPSPPALTIITGASRGMGLAMAQQLLREGQDLLCISRQTNADLAAQAQQLGQECEQWSCDLSQAVPVAERLSVWLGARANARPATITLINNAGVLPAISALHQVPLEQLAWAMRVDLEAPLLLSAAFLSATANWTEPRKLLNISSGLSQRAMAASAAYCAAKAGMDHFTRCVALEQAALPNGARVCSLAPGVIDTDMQVQLRGADTQQFPDRGNFVNLKAQGLLTSPEVAAQRVLAYLARPDFGAQAVADVRNA